jgi:predicted ArsR family transcriptional regulator
MTLIKKALSFLIGFEMPSDNSSRLLYTLKSRGPLATNVLARSLGITVVGIRQHLAKLHTEGLVAFDEQTGEIGRPKRFWRLTAKGHGRFPDTHGDLTVNLIGGIRLVFGEAGLDRLIAARQEAAVAAYRSALEPCSSLEDRVRTLALLRTEEATWPNSRRRRTAVFSSSKIIVPFAQRPRCARASAGQSWNCFEPRSAPERQSRGRSIFSRTGGAVSIG